MAGQLYNAHRDGSAIVVTAGLRDPAMYSDDVVLSPRQGFTQADINRQFTKISWEVRNSASIPLATRRAYKVACAAPGGPVYVAFSSHCLEAARATGDIWPQESFMIQARPRPAKDQLEMLARWLIEARQPMLIFGDEIWKSGGQAEAVKLAELLGVAVATGNQSYRNFPTDHIQYVGGYSGTRPYPTGGGDLVVQFGTRDMGGLDIPAKPLIDPAARFVAIGIDTNTLGRTQPMDLAIVADAKATCVDLLDAVGSLATADRLRKIREERLAIVKAAVAKARAQRNEAARKNFELSPIHPDRLGWEIDQAADADAILVSENLTGSNGLFRLGYRPDEKLWLGNTGASLGWGAGAAIGAKFGAPDRQVILSIGDGSVMYGSSAFWTMARYHVPVLTVVWNNHNYQTVRNAYFDYKQRMAETGHYHGLYLGDPAIDFVKLADSQGVKGERVTAAKDIRAALDRGIQATRDGNPYLVEVVISRVGGGADSTWHQTYNLAATRTKRA
jgi:benzoylformate decarboxylase